MPNHRAKSNSFKVATAFCQGFAAGPVYSQKGEETAYPWLAEQPGEDK